MRSMTGFGAATQHKGGTRVTAEIRSVNNRYFKASFRTPPALASREHEMEDLLRARIARGTVNVWLWFERERPEVTVDEAVAAEYARRLRRLGRDLRLPGEPDLALLASLPGVVKERRGDEAVSDEDWNLVCGVLTAALARLSKMREREGANLARDFARRAKAVAALVKAIAARAPRVKEEYLGRLRDRVQRMVADAEVAVADRDLFRELAVFAERSDVTEELTRLRSHLDQFGAALTAGAEVGRRLDFLVQEMAREANTIGSKAGDAEVSRLCVDLKVEMDRLKEQVQNVE